MTVGDDSLTQQMTAENTGDAAFDLTAALHTYFKVSDISKVSVCRLPSAARSRKSQEP